MGRACGITYVTGIVYLVKSFIKIVPVTSVKSLSNETPVELTSLYKDACEFSSAVVRSEFAVSARVFSFSIWKH